MSHLDDIKHNKDPLGNPFDSNQLDRYIVFLLLLVDKENRPYLTKEQVADICGISRTSVYTVMARNNLILDKYGLTKQHKRSSIEDKK